MSKQIKVVIGANFGDEGKGLMTDYFCHELSKDGYVLNVRHNGGAQAGHTVVTPDGKRHVFSHFGAGSFNPHVATYLSENYILNPILFVRELEALKRKFDMYPLVYVNPRCRITIPFDMLINQAAETFRGDARHGTCGIGINETVHRNLDQNGFVLTAGMVSPLYSPTAAQLVAILLYLRKQYVPYRFQQLGVSAVPTEYLARINDDRIIEHWIEDLATMMRYCIVKDDDIFLHYDRIVFEGAQGLLLDNDYKEFAPYLTTSKTGSVNPKRIMIKNGLENEDVEFCYVTRSYFTRHGAGTFPTECACAHVVADGGEDKTNHTNEFQGAFRYGYFETERFREALDDDRLIQAEHFPNAKFTMAVTHLDETGGKLILNKNVATDAHGGFAYESYGETRDDVRAIPKNAQ